MPAFLSLPVGAKRQIAGNLDDEDLNALTRTNGSLHTLLNPRLYKQNEKALRWAAKHRQCATVQLCLNSITSRKARLIALCIAAENGCKGVVRLLLQIGDLDFDEETDPEEFPTRSRTAISHAALAGYKGNVRLLVAAGAATAIKDRGRRSHIVHNLLTIIFAKADDEYSYSLVEPVGNDGLDPKFEVLSESGFKLLSL